MHTAQIRANFAQNQPSKRLLAKKQEKSRLMTSGKPSQALPRQLSRRESQAVKFGTKVLGTTRKLLGVLLALPLGELAKP